MSRAMWNRDSRARPSPDSASSRIDSPSLTSALPGGATISVRPSLSEERPAFDDAGEAEIQAVVAGDVGRGFRRAVLFEIGRRGNHHHPALPEFARDQLRIAKRPGADRDVGALLEQVDHLVGENDVDGDLRMLSQERRQHRHQIMLAERHVAVDAQPAARRRPRRGLTLGRVDLAKDADAALVEGRTLRRELQLARGAVEEPGTEPVLQPADQLAHRRRRHIEKIRGGGQRAALDHADEDFDLAGAVDVCSAHL